MSVNKNVFIAVSVVFSLSACTSMYDKHVEWEVVQPKEYPVLTAVGYAPVDAQQGSTSSIKEIMAMKASKLDAYRELAEQVYGQRIEGNQSIANMVMGDTQMQASVEGLIRGARVVKSYPVGEDTYATELELDMETVYQLYLSTAKPRQIKAVKYY
ncbi:LPP20 family lipoprotein [Alteromonas ponticola]|uniref:Flagellar biosynthesis protein FlgP n=1 Tax=Alteromonas ponticola TaxID=2720613 RepID=A0ABX1QZN4_9ALTE|nr:LPP20 family lipoprotein [Alteromonas ponticola]NMH59688.1 flagellar biosynthesis protein FlgP [Alteromonas ponticola]